MLKKESDKKAASERLGARLKELVEASEYTVPMLAKHFAISPEAVYSWFKTGRIRKEKLAELAGLLGTSVEGILNDGPPTTAPRASDLEWSFAAQKLGSLFDHLPDRDRKLAWPWLVHMLAHSPALVTAFLPYPVENKRVEAAYGKAGGPSPRRPQAAAGRKTGKK